MSFPVGPVTLENIKPDQFQDILQFMYTGEVLVSTNNIESLLSAADILEMNDFKKALIRFLYNSLNADTALLYWRLAIKYREKQLASNCQIQVIRDFKKLNSVSSLKNLSEEMLKVILSANNLEVKSEVEVCAMLLKWLEVQTEAGHEVHPDQLLPLIRWDGINVDYVKSKLLENTTLTSDPSLSFMTKVITYLMSGVQFKGLQTIHRPSTNLENCFMVV